MKDRATRIIAIIALLAAVFVLIESRHPSSATPSAGNAATFDTVPPPPSADINVYADCTAGSLFVTNSGWPAGTTFDLMISDVNDPEGMGVDTTTQLSDQFFIGDTWTAQAFMVAPDGTPNGATQFGGEIDCV